MREKAVSLNDLMLNRRSFLGAGLASGASLLAASTMQAKNILVTDRYQLNNQTDKQWAQLNLRGGESFVMPTMQPDLKALDEEGIRRDVRHAIAQQFCSVMPLQLGIDTDAHQRLQEIVIAEAGDQLFTVGVIRPGDWASQKSAIRAMENTGISHALMYINRKLPSQDAMTRQMREVIDNTSLKIILYAKPRKELYPLDPTGLPLDTFEQLAELDNVVGVKFTQTLRPATAYALTERLGDRLLLGVVDIEMMLPLAEKSPIQWTGQWGMDSLQSPENPWLKHFLELLRTNKFQQANQLYWQYEPIATFFYQMQEPSLSIGGHPWLHIKYMKWLTGGNGGLLPNLHEPMARVPHLNAANRKKCRDIFKQVGIKTVDLPDEAFVVGNHAYEQGVRIDDLAAIPQYSVK